MSLHMFAFVVAAPLYGSGPAPAVVSDAERVSWSTGVDYSYDGSGNVVSIGNQKYYYDSAGRLVYSTNPEGGATGYTYDAFGNRKSCTPPEGGSCQAGLTVNSANNRLSAPVAYDTSGRVTSFQGHTFAYDAVDMPHRDTFGGTTEYIYTAGDERIAVVNPTGQWEWSVRGPSGKVIREFTSTGSTNFQWRKDYIWRDELLLATRQREPDGTITTYHYHLDHLGTPRRITDDADRIVGKSDYDPFGSRLSGGTNPPSANRMQFTGHERDTGPLGEQSDTLDYMHARYYSPYGGRFLSVDPKNRYEATAAPQEWNRYAYAINNPMKYFDPDGLDHTIYLVQAFSSTETPRNTSLLADALPKGFTLKILSEAYEKQALATLAQAEPTDWVILQSHASPRGLVFSGAAQLRLTAPQIVEAANDGTPPTAIILSGCDTATTAAVVNQKSGILTIGGKGGIGISSQIKAIAGMFRAGLLTDAEPHAATESGNVALEGNECPTSPHGMCHGYYVAYTDPEQQ